MDCRTASLLTEAYHDDELDLVDAARLLAHFEDCPSCRARCDESGRLREAVRSGRPVDRCPEELARRLAAHCQGGRARARRGWRVPFVVLAAGGCGILAGFAGARAGLFGGPVALASFRSSRTFGADVFCLRCALRALFPGERVSDDGPHRPVLRTADGRIWVVAPESAARTRLVESAAPRHVVVTAALDERTGVAEVSDVSDAAAAAPAAPAPAR